MHPSCPDHNLWHDLCIRCHLHDLPLSCCLGVYPEERNALTTLHVSLTYTFPPPTCDALEATLDYDLVAQLCHTVARSQIFYLVETLAMALYQALHKQFAFQTLNMRLTKPGVPKGAHGITIEVQCPPY